MNFSSRIQSLLDSMSPRPLVLAHHYQIDSIVALADRRGDSLDLARAAAEATVAEAIIFCGVHFMAETADILTSPHQRVYMPDPTANCPLADMADLPAVSAAWKWLEDLGKKKMIPVTYINSSASLKAFCGRHGGTVCTSSNAGRVLRWAFEQGESAFFFPDRHLGENTALGLGIDDERIVVWDEEKTAESAYRALISRAKVILWPGFCPIHFVFTAGDVTKARKKLPGCRVAVHPECRREVAEAADVVGSTKAIIEAVTRASSGTSWAVGTEIHLVRRLEHECRGKTVIPLRVSSCRNMVKHTPEKLYRLVQTLREGAPPPAIMVDPETASMARTALHRMLELS